MTILAAGGGTALLCQADTSAAHMKKMVWHRIQGSGFRGGNWNNGTANARVSDRINAANTNTNRNNNNGARCANTSTITKRAGVSAKVLLLAPGF